MTRLARVPVSALFSLVVCGWAVAAPLKTVHITKATLVETLSPVAIDKLAGVLFKPLPAPRARFSVDSWLLTFESVYPDGAPATITAQLFIPRYTDAAVRPLYVFASGSTGLTSACRVSREHIAGIRWGLYRTHVLAWAGQGVIGMLPDYMGFADKGRLQPFYSAVAEGRLMLDAVRAARTFLGGEPAAGQSPQGIDGFKAFLAGFSQGGHAIFAAADLRESWAPDVALAGVIGYGPAADVYTLFREFPVDAPMAIYTYEQMYGKQRFDPSLILLPKWADTLEDDVTRQCIGGMQAYYPWTPRELFRKDFADALLAGKLAEKYPSIDRVLKENSSGLTRHHVPALILEGTDDIVVSVKSQTAFATALRALGSPVQLSIYKGARHDTRQAGFSEALQWVKSITSGGSPPSGTANR
jgi:pimeloyl-ACP methyl ester carboxylesterase